MYDDDDDRNIEITIMSEDFGVMTVRTVIPDHISVFDQSYTEGVAEGVRIMVNALFPNGGAESAKS